MKLVLCSEGFSTPNTVKACVELCGKPQHQISIAIINEGYAVEEGDKYWVLDNLNDVAKNFKGGIDIVNILALPLNEVVSRIEKRDVIFVIGGNNDYLMHVFEETGFAKLLPKLLEKKVYVGSSAGSMIVGKRISDQAYGAIYGKYKTFGVKEYLNLVDFAIKPHLNSPSWPNNRAENLAAICGNTNFAVYALKDDTAIVVDGNRRTYTGSMPVKIQGGNIIEKHSLEALS
jgi:dipeptidase E